MSQANLPNELGLFLRPEYWGVRSFDDIPLERLRADFLLYRSLRRSRDVLIGLLGRNAELSAYRTLKLGDTFEADDYHPGTVVVFREEALMGRILDRSVEHESLKRTSLPPRPVGISRRLGADMLKTIRGGNSIYDTGTRFGVVGPKTHKGVALHTVSAGLIEQSSDGLEIDLIAFVANTLPIRVGETQRFRLSYGTQRLLRINAMEVVALGEAKRATVSQRIARRAVPGWG